MMRTENIHTPLSDTSILSSEPSDKMNIKREDTNPIPLLNDSSQSDQKLLNVKSPNVTHPHMDQAAELANMGAFSNHPVEYITTPNEKDSLHSNSLKLTI